jgi:N-acetylglucosaminyldiphosphoundecaprenol N-acetyl-beta-D-mannosaminyltransferase
MKKIDNISHLWSLSLFSRDRNSLLNEVITHLEHSRKTAYIFTPNPEQVILAEKNQEFQHILQSADWLIPDGSGLLWASRILQNPEHQLTKRIPGVELSLDLLQYALNQCLKVLIVGGRNYAGLSVASQKIQEYSSSDKGSSNSGLYWVSGYQQVQQPTRVEEESLQAAINQLKPDIILVALGAPYQEEWTIKYLSVAEKSRVKLIMVVGGAIDMLTGQIKRAPSWVRELGLEWLYRLVTQPWRWRRQLSLVSFIWLVLKTKWAAQK